MLLERPHAYTHTVSNQDFSRISIYAKTSVKPYNATFPASSLFFFLRRQPHYTEMFSKSSARAKSLVFVKSQLDDKDREILANLAGTPFDAELKSIIKQQAVGIGFDFGTTRCCIAGCDKNGKLEVLYDTTQSKALYLVQSVVSFPLDEVRSLVGHKAVRARHRLDLPPQNNACCMKRFRGRTYAITIL
jgi:hypothetical protein